jgi:hypothetical protein
VATGLLVGDGLGSGTIVVITTSGAGGAARRGIGKV